MALLGACSSIEPSTLGVEWFEYSGDDSPHRQAVDRNTHYTNPIIAGFYPDPSIEKVRDRYYLVNSSFSYFPGIPVFESDDLVNWRQVGNVIDRVDQLDFGTLGISRGIFAPAISFHDDRFYLISTCVDCGGTFVVTADQASGPWSKPTFLDGVQGIDPSIFFDDDGRAYIVYNGEPQEPPRYDGHRALWAQEFDHRNLRLVGKSRVVIDGGARPEENPIWIEGPHFFRRNGQLYLIAAEGGTAENHSEVVFKADTPFGPFVAYPGNPILTQRHLDEGRPDPIVATGHADFVIAPEGDWWAVFLGTRPYAGGFHNTGRETFLAPVQWKNDWPVITEGDETIPAIAVRPSTGATGHTASQPTSGNFRLREEFDESGISLDWVRPRQLAFSDYASIEDGALWLSARSDSLGGFGRPSFIARRQQHQNATATARLNLEKLDESGFGGIAAFQNDEFFYLLAVSKSAGKDSLELRRRNGGGSLNGDVIASTPLETIDFIDLRIEAAASVYRFYYRINGENWTRIGKDEDGTILSTQRSGGFVGAMFGLFAHQVR
jgi:alpha-N-arabinofuranosidase